jgi:glutamyl-tRNA(Gln) amidotransferase subunit D
MYSQAIEKLLKKKGIKIGEAISIKKGDKSYTGILMPRPELGSPNCIVLKLPSGYNIGIAFDSSTEIKRITKKSVQIGRVGKKFIALKFDTKKPPISLIATGGTIASRIDYRTGGVCAIKEPKEFLFNCPELANIINLKRIVTPFTKMSEDMDYLDWQIIAKNVASEINSGCEGVIVTHGTDTLHFTSAALSFMLRGLTKPVIVVGAQRSSDRGSSDAGINIICAAHAAISNIAEVATCMHGSTSDDYCLIIRGTKVRKMHTSRRDAFRPINDIPLAKVWPDGRMEILKNNFRKRGEGKVEADTKFEPKIAILKTYPGSDPDVIDYYISKGYKGFVIEGSGLGHVPTFARKSWIENISKTVKDGIPVVITAQTIYGRINQNVYTNLRILYHKARAISGEDMLTETAYVKLGWLLGHTKDIEEIRQLMAKNIAGEITERSEPEFYLY